AASTAPEARTRAESARHHPGIAGRRHLGTPFVATRIGLDDLSPAQLAAARFVIAAVPVLVLARPAVPWTMLIAVGLTLFAGQFLLCDLLRRYPTAAVTPF